MANRSAGASSGRGSGGLGLNIKDLCLLECHKCGPGLGGEAGVDVGGLPVNRPKALLLPVLHSYWLGGAS